MIEIGNKEITTIEIGRYSVIEIDIGSTKVWPTSGDVVVTYSLINTSRVYSTGTYIQASGSNYAYITGTLVRYENGVEVNRTQTTLIPSFVVNPDSNVWSISGNEIHAADSGIEPRPNSRSASVRGYSSVTGEYYGPFDVWQEANTYSPVGTGSMIFQLNGRGTLTEVDEHHSRLAINYDSSMDPYGFNTWIQRDVIYTSGHTDRLTVSGDAYYSYIINPNTFATITDSAGTTYSNITSPRYISGVKLSTARFADLSGTADRGMSITARDVTYPTAIYREIAITQYANHVYRLDVYDTDNNYYLRYDSSSGTDTRTPMTISANTSGFTLTAYSTQDSVKYPLTTSSITTTGSIGLTCTSVVNSPSTSALYKMTFTCDVNTAASSRTATIGILQGMTIHRISITQAANTEVFDGITEKARSGNWIIGTVENGNSIAIVIVKDSPITQDATVNISHIAWQWQPDPSVTPISYSENNLTQTITAGQTIPLNDKTYYGYLFYSPAMPGFVNRPRTQINEINGFSVS